MTFKEWMDEIENFSTRLERMNADIGFDGYKWVKAAYEQGYKQCADDREKDYEC